VDQPRGIDDRKDRKLAGSVVLERDAATVLEANTTNPRLHVCQSLVRDYGVSAEKIEDAIRCEYRSAA
jgi:hypothetical protein